HGVRRNHEKDQREQQERHRAEQRPLVQQGEDGGGEGAGGGEGSRPGHGDAPRRGTGRGRESPPPRSVSEGARVNPDEATATVAPADGDTFHRQGPRDTHVVHGAPTTYSKGSRP